MFYSRLLMLAVLAQAAGPLWADATIAYVPMTICPAQPYDSVRDYWDHTGEFCFESNHRREVWPISDMGEVTLRHDGQWLPSPYVDVLTDEHRATVAHYEHYSVRYLALGRRDALGAQPFVAQVFYSAHGARLTTYAFGEINALGAIRLTGYSDAGEIAARPRAILKTIKHVFALFRGKNPNHVAVEEVKNEERRRVRPVVDVIKQHRAPVSLLPRR